MRPKLPRWLKQHRGLVATVTVVCLLPVMLGAASLGVLAAQGTGTPPATIKADGWDGLWLGHAWVSGDRTDTNLARLARRLRANGIRDVFVHTGPLKGDGSLDPALAPTASWLIAGLHKRVPGVRVQAWLGDLVGPGHLDLGQPTVRNRILAGAALELQAGFDGVHYDMEPVASGDPGYLTLLTDTHALTRRDRKILSVACDQVELVPGLATPAQWITGRPHFWSDDYLRAVAGRSDEIALMTYDTGMPVGAAYTGFVRAETTRALRAASPGTTVLIGLPAYHTTESGHTSAETVAAAVKGVRMALGGSRAASDVGVSLYADFSATPADWAAYTAGWASRR